MLLLPVRFRHVENAQKIVAYTITYSSAANNIQSYYIVNVACVFDVRSGKIRFPITKVHFIETRSEKPEVCIILPPLDSEAQVIQ